MSGGPEWSIESFRTDSGRFPVREFIDSLDEPTQDDVLAAFEYLRIRNVHARTPHVKHVRDKLYELRVTSNDNNYRFFYFFYINRRIVILHAIEKKRQDLPKADIDLAIKRMHIVLSQGN